MSKILKYIPIILLFSTSVFGQWVQIATVSTTQLNAVKFFDQYTGVTCGVGGIWRSTNSGVNWAQVYIGGSWNGLSFPDNLNGFVVGDSGRIVKSNDGGVSWNVQGSGITENLNGVYFYNALTGHAVGLNHRILRTQNGGLNWIIQNSSSFDNFYSVNMFNNQIAAVAGGETNAVIEVTNNGGSSWIGIGYSGYNFRSCYYITIFKLIACGSNGLIRKTVDAGANWSTIPSGTNNQLNSLLFLDGSNGYITGNQGTVLKSTDAGDNWAPMNTSTNNNLRSISFINSNTGWIAGQNGLVLRMGIPVGIEEEQTIKENYFYLYPNYPNPFNPETKITFKILKDGFVSLTLFDVTGKEIKKIINGFYKSGEYSNSISGNDLVSGIYFCKMEYKNPLYKLDYVAIIKLLLIK